MRRPRFVPAVLPRLHLGARPRVGILAVTLSLLALVWVLPAKGAPVVAFQNDFNHDTVDAAPTQYPPLFPPNDYIYFNTSGGSILVRSAVGDLTDQPLELDSATGSAYFKFEAATDATYNDCSSYAVRWRSLIDWGLFYVTVAIRDVDSRLIAALEYRQSRVLSFNGSGNQLATQWTSDVAQLFEVTIDMPTETVSLSIDGVPQPEAQGLPFYQSSATTLEKLIIDGTAGYGLAIDDIEIIGDGCPAAPVEPETWGRVKARYRVARE